MTRARDNLAPDAVKVNVTEISAGNTALAAVMPAVPGYRNVLCGFDITGTGATAAGTIDVTTTGCPAGSNPALHLAVPAGVTANAVNTGWSPKYPFGVEAALVNSAITVNVPAFGAGNTGAVINLYGYRYPSRD